MWSKEAFRRYKKCVLLGYLKDSNAAAHSVDSDIFYVVIDLSARSKYYISRGV